jgi:hypothetical protein
LSYSFHHGKGKTKADLSRASLVCYRCLQMWPHGVAFCTECLCHLKIYMLKPNPHGDGIWRRDLWEVIRSWGQSPHEWD